MKFFILSSISLLEPRTRQKNEVFWGMERRIPFAFTVVILVLLFRLAEQGNAGEENISVLFLPILMYFTLFTELRVTFVPMVFPRYGQRSRHSLRERGSILRFENSKKMKYQKSLHWFLGTEKAVNKGTFYRNSPLINPFQTYIVSFEHTPSWLQHFGFLSRFFKSGD